MEERGEGGQGLEEVWEGGEEGKGEIEGHREGGRGRRERRETRYIGMY